LRDTSATGARLADGEACTGRKNGWCRAAQDT